jgi:hypothetical protein
VSFGRECGGVGAILAGEIDIRRFELDSESTQLAIASFKLSFWVIGEVVGNLWHDACLIYGH